MSDKDIKQEKIVTRYDRKMQRRKEEKERELRQKKITTTVGIIIAVALVAWIASFPILTYLATHETYIIVNGEKITRAEFDYNYSNVANQYSAFLGNMDFSTQMYSDTLTWQDYFEQQAVENMKRDKALKAMADAAGFTFDASEEIKEFKDTLKEAAKTAGVSTSKYLKQVYGQYASVSSISHYIEETARNNAYYEEFSKGMEPSEEEVLAYYEENSANYDSVDYYVSSFEAELPDDFDDEGIAAAMEKALELALAAEENIMDDGDEETDATQSSIPSVLSNWLFDKLRKEGDTTVIEDGDNYMYYVLGFSQRHRDDTPRANVRVIMTQDMDGQAILDEWTAGVATEESFAELANKYSADNGEVANGGLYEEVTWDSISSDMAAWIFADGRKAGDTGYVTTEEGYTYVMYYVEQLDPEWKQSVKDTLLSRAQQEYINNLIANVVVEDPMGNLNYLKVLADVSDGDEWDDDMEDDVYMDDISDGDIIEDSNT